MSIHHRNLQILATEMFRVYTRSATDILNEGFSITPPSNCNLRNQQEFILRHVKTVHYGLNSLTYLGPRIWELLSNDLKRLESVEAFKAGYLRTAHAEFLNHISTKLALYKFISIGCNLFIYLLLPGNRIVDVD